MNPVRFFTAPFQLKNAIAIIGKYERKEREAGGSLQVNTQSLREFREAQKVVSSIIHPDTGKAVPFYGRMSGFVPMNLPIVFMLLMAKPTTFNIIFAQWINQTYNSGMNYSNRNATSVYT